METPAIGEVKGRNHKKHRSGGSYLADGFTITVIVGVLRATEGVSSLGTCFLFARSAFKIWR